MRIAKGTYRHDTDMNIQDKKACQQFEMRTGGAFRPLLLVDDNEVSFEDMYDKFKDATNSIMQDVV